MNYAKGQEQYHQHAELLKLICWATRIDTNEVISTAMQTTCIRTINTNSVYGWLGCCLHVSLCGDNDADGLMSDEKKRNDDIIVAGVSMARFDTRMHLVSS